MSPPETWGPPIWTFFHTLAEKINDDQFHEIKASVFSVIKRICKFLPCPECSQHASQFLGRININSIQNKIQFKQMLCFFHNTVNKRKNKSIFKFENTNKYKNCNIGNAFNNFIRVYHTKGNMNMIAESFQRKLLIDDLRKWFVDNHKYLKPTKINPICVNKTNNESEALKTNVTPETNVIPETNTAI